jgi:polysaccharide lyase-like protein
MMKRRAILFGLVLIAALAAALARDARPGVGHALTPTAAAPKKPAPPHLQFDGRATRLRTLWSRTADDQGVDPRIWDGLLFQNNDISIIPDSRYGKVYSVRAGAGSTNPFYNVGSDNASAELTTIRANRLGNWDWYGLAVRIEPGFVTPDWCAVAQLNYPSLSSPPASLDLRGVNGKLYWSLQRNAGFLYRAASWGWEGQVREEPVIIPAEIGKWTEFVIGILWKTDSTGQIEVYTRIRDNGQKRFVLRLVRRKTPTWQYGSTPSGNVRSNGTDVSDNRQHSSLDKEGLYFGYSAGSAFPTNRVSENGLIRSSSRAVVFANMP